MQTPASAIERAILTTISYFDLFSFPLTAFEIWKWLYTDEEAFAPSLREVRQVLRESRFLKQQLEDREGYWVLAGRGGIIEERKRRHLLSEAKHDRLRRAVSMFRYFPGIRAIALCNSASYNNANENSDLDLLIFAKPGRIWTARMFTAGIAKLLRWRPTPEKTADGICLSFYLADTQTDLAKLTLGTDDPYMRYWLDQAVVVFGDHDALEELRQANAWYRHKLPNALGSRIAHRRRVSDSRVSSAVRSFLDAVHRGQIGNALESVYRNMQMRILPLTLRSLANKDTRVIISDAMLKFHDKDRREQFTGQLNQRIKEVLRA